MIPLIFAGLSAGASLYTLMSAVDSTAMKVDNYVEDNVDIFTESPVLGHPQIVARLRSKGERRIIEAYNELMVNSIDQIQGSKIGLKWKTAGFKFDQESLYLMFRLGEAFKSWWSHGFTGQIVDLQEILDPKVGALFRTLSNQDKALIARAQALLSFSEER